MTKILNLKETESKRDGSQAGRYSFISTPPQLVFPMNHTTIGKFNYTEDRFEKGEILPGIKGDRSQSFRKVSMDLGKKLPYKDCGCKNVYQVWEMVFNSICRYGSLERIKMDETKIVVYHLLWFIL